MSQYYAILSKLGIPQEYWETAKEDIPLNIVNELKDIFKDILDKKIQTLCFVGQPSKIKTKVMVYALRKMVQLGYTSIAGVSISVDLDTVDLQDLMVFDCTAMASRATAEKMRELMYIAFHKGSLIFLEIDSVDAFVGRFGGDCFNILTDNSRGIEVVATKKEADITRFICHSE